MTSSIRTLYLAGPYRTIRDAHGKIESSTEQNIARAREVARDVVRLGRHYPVTPHLNTAAFDNENTDAFFLVGTLRLMLQCDDLLMLPLWTRSEGARAELATARERFRPPRRIFLSLADYRAAVIAPPEN